MSYQDVATIAFLWAANSDKDNAKVPLAFSYYTELENSEFNLTRNRNTLFKITQLFSCLATLDELRVSCRIRTTHSFREIGGSLDETQNVSYSSVFTIPYMGFEIISAVSSGESFPSAMPFLFLLTCIDCRKVELSLPSES